MRGCSVVRLVSYEKVANFLAITDCEGITRDRRTARTIEIYRRDEHAHQAELELSLELPTPFRAPPFQ